MAAVTSTSLGTDIATARPVTSEHTEMAGMSFAENFAESTALTGESTLPVAGSTKTAAEADSSEHNPGKISKALSSTGTEITPMANIFEAHEETEKMKSSSSTEAAVATGVAANKTGSSVIAAAPKQSGKADGGTNSVLQSKAPDDQFMPSVPQIEDNHAREIGHETTVESVLGGSDTATSSDLQIVPPAAAATDRNEKLVIADKNESPITDKSRDENSIGKIAKDHSTPVKTGKGAKAEDKQDRAAVSVVGVEAQSIASAQVFVSPISGQQSGSKAAVDADVLSPALSVPSARKGMAVVTAKDKSGKEATSAVKEDGNNIKAPGASIAETQLSQKTEADATKPGLTVASNSDDEKSKTQSPTLSATDSGQLHSAPISLGPVAGAVSGLTHAAAATPAAEAISHAVATVQAGSNSIAPATPGEAAPHTMMATPTSLEVSVANGTHGWLKIRAEMADGGTVNTSLSPSSIAGQQMLHRELPSLAAYLKSEHVAVNTVVVQPIPANGSDTRGLLGGTGGNGHAQQSGSQARQGQQDSATPARVPTSALYSGTETAGEGEVFPSTSYLSGGGWLSVRA